MNLKSSLSLFIVLLTIACTPKKDESSISLGLKDKLFSKVLNEDREIWVYDPSSNRSQRALGKKKYPVIYLLDGDAHFHAVASMARQLNGLCPEVIVVGIPNTDRTRDLTHTHVSVVFGDSTFSKT